MSQLPAAVTFVVHTPLRSEETAKIAWAWKGIALPGRGRYAWRRPAVAVGKKKVAAEWAHPAVRVPGCTIASAIVALHVSLLASSGGTAMFDGGRSTSEKTLKRRGPPGCTSISTSIERDSARIDRPLSPRVSGSSARPPLPTAGPISPLARLFAKTRATQRSESDWRY